MGKPIVHLHQVPKGTLLEVKRRNDKNGKKREWVSNMYLKDGLVMLGDATEGDYNGVRVTPDKQLEVDKKYTGMVECISAGLDKETCKQTVRYGAPTYGVSKDNQLTTIHMHPISPFETSSNAENRSKFSGTDIGSEVAKSIRDGETRQMFLTFPDAEKKGLFFGIGSPKRHNVMMNVIFPGKECYDIMKASNPHLSHEQIMAITPDGGNMEQVDWAAYQREAKKRGYVEEVDIEQATGAEAYASYGNYYAGFVVAGVIATVVAVYIINKKFKKKV